MINRLRAILAMKDRVSYTGSYYRLEDTARLLGDARSFCAWAEDVYARRPAG